MSELREYILQEGLPRGMKALKDPKSHYINQRQMADYHGKMGAMDKKHDPDHANYMKDMGKERIFAFETPALFKASIA